MIKVKNLSKTYVKNKALDNVSFSISEGEILGFLGPNGAGKSTTMNIITGYLSSDSGSVEINGKDIMEEPAAVKKMIGYLPEQPPLYNDMTVEKYLEFMFKLKKVRLPMKEHISKICEDVKISDVRNRIIKNLSKGYRQRVGLAQALLGDPKVLILDDSTSAVDTKTDKLIRKAFLEEIPDTTKIIIAQRISSVQDVDKIIVMDKGRIDAVGTHEELLKNNKIYSEVYYSQQKGSEDNG